MPEMKLKHRNRLLLLGIFLSAIAFCILFGVSLRVLNQLTMPEQLRQREQLKLITADLELDMSRAQAIEIIDKYKRSTIRVSEDEDEIWLLTKPQLLATDWKVHLFFEKDQLTAVKWCSSDNNSERPKGASPDITE